LWGSCGLLGRRFFEVPPERLNSLQARVLFVPIRQLANETFAAPSLGRDVWPLLRPRNLQAAAKFINDWFHIAIKSHIRDFGKRNMIPNMGRTLWHALGMPPRQVLAENLKLLMAQHADLGTLAKLTIRSGISNGTLDRIRRAEVATTVDVLERLGAVFGIEPWELLVPARKRTMLHSVMEAADRIAAYKVASESDAGPA
jgi:transcriptional regulator with XRE-family HTH domain